MKILSKQPHHSGFEGFDIITDDHGKWSVLDFGGKKWRATYKTPELKKLYGLSYKGWEAYNVESQQLFRADSYEEIEKMILNTPPLSLTH